MSIKLSDFLIFMWFLDFWHKRRKWLNKHKKKQQYSQMDKQTINMLHKELIKEVCAPTQTDLSYYKYVKHTTHKRVKELYQHQWSYGVMFWLWMLRISGSPLSSLAIGLCQHQPASRLRPRPRGGGWLKAWCRISCCPRTFTSSRIELRNL